MNSVGKLRTSLRLVLRQILFGATIATLMTGCTRCGGPTSVSTPEQPGAVAPTAAPKVLPTVSDLIIEDRKPGKGASAKSGSKVTVHYVGTLMDGTKFDSSRDRNQPFTFLLGAGQVIQGWDKGVEGMKIGGVRVLKIPGSMAYGERGAGNIIPPNASLVFEVELLDVK